MIQVIDDGLRFVGAHPRSGQLDRQGQAVETAAQFGHGRSVGGIQLEAELGAAGPLHEQRHRRATGQIGQLRRAPGRFARPHFGRHGQGRHVIHVLGAQPKGGPAGRQHFQRRRAQQQSGHIASGFDHMLEVVQHQQELFAAQVMRQLLPGGRVDAGMQAERLGDGRADLRGGAERGERHKAGAGGEVLLRAGGGFDGQARLAHAGRADQVDEADVGRPQHASQVSQLIHPANQGIRRQGEAAHIIHAGHASSEADELGKIGRGQAQRLPE